MFGCYSVLLFCVLASKFLQSPIIVWFRTDLKFRTLVELMISCAVFIKMYLQAEIDSPDQEGDSAMESEETLSQILKKPPNDLNDI